MLEPVQVVLEKKFLAAGLCVSLKNPNENQMNPGGDGKRSVLRSSIKPDQAWEKTHCLSPWTSAPPLTLQSFRHWTDMRERDPPIWGPKPPHLNPGSAVCQSFRTGSFFPLAQAAVGLWSTGEAGMGVLRWKLARRHRAG